MRARNDRKEGKGREGRNGHKMINMKEKKGPKIGMENISMPIALRSLMSYQMKLKGHFEMLLWVILVAINRRVTSGLVWNVYQLNDKVLNQNVQNLTLSTTDSFISLKADNKIHKSHKSAD